MTTQPRVCAIDTGLSADQFKTSLVNLQNYCCDRQAEAAQLAAVLEAAELIGSHGIDQKAVSGLINVALAMAQRLNDRLDYINLPEGGAA